MRKKENVFAAAKQKPRSGCDNNGNSKPLDIYRARHIFIGKIIHNHIAAVCAVYIFSTSILLPTFFGVFLVKYANAIINWSAKRISIVCAVQKAHFCQIIDISSSIRQLNVCASENLLGKTQHHPSLNNLLLIKLQTVYVHLELKIMDCGPWFCNIWSILVFRRITRQRHYKRILLLLFAVSSTIYIDTLERKKQKIVYKKERYESKRKEKQSNQNMKSGRIPFKWK